MRPEEEGPEATRPEEEGPEATRPEEEGPEATRPEEEGPAWFSLTGGTRMYGERVSRQQSIQKRLRTSSQGQGRRQQLGDKILALIIHLQDIL